MTVMSPMFGGASARASLWDAITRAGLTANCRVCLDAGDALSYGGTGQIWTDRSGNQNFFLGANATPSTNDPTFNGTAGHLGVNEYFNYDGGDWFRVVGTQPSWVETLHKHNALFSFFSVIQKSTIDEVRMLGTDGGDSNFIGMDFDTTSGERLRFGVTNGSGAAAFNTTSDSAVSLDKPTALAVSINEAGGNVSFLWENGAHKMRSAANTFDAAYNSPSAGGASHIVEVGSRGGGTFPASDGVRIYAIAAWQGQALTKAQIDSIYLQVRDRWGLS